MRKRAVSLALLKMRTSTKMYIYIRVLSRTFFFLLKRVKCTMSRERVERKKIHAKRKVHIFYEIYILHECFNSFDFSRYLLASNFWQSTVTRSNESVRE